MREGAQSEHVRRKSLPVGVLSSLRHRRKRGRKNEIYVTESAYLRQRAERSEERGRQKGVKRGLQASQTLFQPWPSSSSSSSLSQDGDKQLRRRPKGTYNNNNAFPPFLESKSGKTPFLLLLLPFFFFHFWHPASSLDPISLSLLLLPFLLPVPPNPSCLFFSRRAHEGERRRRNKTFAVRRQWIFLLPSLLSSR